MSVEDSHLEPSLLDPSRFNLRNKGLRTTNGRLYKGCVKDAYTKLSIGSIPSNYESIIYHHEEKRGFGTSQKRFYHAENKSQFIGTIQAEQTPQEKEVQECASHSKKGYGPFIAKQARQWRKFPHSPGPGKYFDQEKQVKTATTKKKPYFPKDKEDFKKKESVLNKQNNDTPGPGYYENIEIEEKHKLTGCRSAFVTKQKRETYIQNNSNPGLGCYTSSSPQKKDPQKREILQNEFFMKLSKQHQPSPKRFIPKRKHLDVPGPGFYYYQEPNFKPLYERVKISNNFIQGNKNRFNDPIQEVSQESPKIPTPCTYSVPSAFDKVQKKLIDMAAFMSESKRQPFTGKGLGPNIANDGRTKQIKNFHFNIRGQWL